MPIEMIDVESSMMRSAGYGKAKCELAIAFVSGEDYIYSDVPESIFRELMAAESKGTYFGVEIRPKFLKYRLARPGELRMKSAVA